MNDCFFALRSVSQDLQSWLTQASDEFAIVVMLVIRVLGHGEVLGTPLVTMLRGRRRWVTGI